MECPKQGSLTLSERVRFCRTRDLMKACVMLVLYTFPGCASCFFWRLIKRSPKFVETAQCARLERSTLPNPSERFTRSNGKISQREQEMVGLMRRLLPVYYIRTSGSEAPEDTGSETRLDPEVGMAAATAAGVSGPSGKAICALCEDLRRICHLAGGS